MQEYTMQKTEVMWNRKIGPPEHLKRIELSPNGL